jgi:hypothetical protein
LCVLVLTCIFGVCAASLANKFRRTVIAEQRLRNNLGLAIYFMNPIFIWFHVLNALFNSLFLFRREI